MPKYGFKCKSCGAKFYSSVSLENLPNASKKCDFCGGNIYKFTNEAHISQYAYLSEKYKKKQYKKEKRGKLEQSVEEQLENAQKKLHKKMRHAYYAISFLISRLSK